MPINIKIIESTEQWTGAENQLAPHTFLQSWEWSQSQAALGQKIFRLGIYDYTRLIGLAFVYLIKARRGTFIFCPHGPVIDWTKAKEIMPILLDYLIKLGKNEQADFIRFSPLAKNSQTNNQLFKTLGFRPAPIHMMHPEMAWLLDLAKPEEEILAGMEKRTRYSIRKAQKDGVKITTSASQEYLDKFYGLYRQTAERQGFVPFSEKYLAKELQSFLQSNKVKIYLAHYNDEPIAAAMIVYSNDSAFYHHGASIRKYSNITAAELLQWTAIQDAQLQGLKYYNFWGIAPAGENNHPWAGLTKFKTGFGGFSDQYLHAQDYILKNKYWLNYIIEKLRKIKRNY